MDIASRLTFRLTREDVAHVATIGQRLQANGRAFVSRTQAIREALRIAAEAVNAEAAAAQAQDR